MRILLNIICICIIQTCLGQATGDTVDIKEVIITDQKLFYHNYKSERIDPIEKAKSNTLNLGDLLSNNSTLFIKNYGPGLLSTSTFRGMSAAHTSLCWNGININSPTLGQSDLALFPNFMYDEVIIDYGSAGISKNAGAFGGTININSTPDFSYKIKVNAEQSIGSFGNSRTYLGLQNSNKKISNKLKAFYQRAENNFGYINNNLNPPITQKQINNSITQYGIINETAFHINEHQKAGITAWYQYSNRQIPPTISGTNYMESQMDEALRILANYSYKQFSFKSAWMDEKLNYINQLADFSSLTQFKTSKNQLSWDKNLKRFLINSTLFYEYYNAYTLAYNEHKYQNRYALFVGITHYVHDRFDYNLQLRQDVIDQKIIPLTGSISMGYKPVQKIKFYLNAGKNYRYPTLNDLYWVPGAYKYLKPEQSTNGEAGCNIKLNYTKHLIDFRISGFSNWINDWIQWQPNALYGYWEPRNLKKVWARGYETILNYTCSIKNIKIKYGTIFSYTKSTNEEVYYINDGSLHRQLIYTPIYNLKSHIGFAYRNTEIRTQYSLISWRAVSTDNYDYLPAYQLIDLMLQQTVQIKNQHFRIGVNLNNILNASYQVLAQRAMPGRNYSLVVTWQFKK